jgi:hypothetical protein
VSTELWPRPREIEWTGQAAAPDAPVRFEASSALPAEGFSLEVSLDGVRIEYADANGRRYAEATLAQLTREDGTRDGVRIRDWPDFPVRGLMLDVSRDRVPTRTTLRRWLGVMRIARLNQLQLYIEHSFAYREHEAVWRDASPITPADVQWLEAECDACGIELVPNLNTFGHMGRWLAHPAYRARAEAPEGWDGPTGTRRAPAVLAPTPENAAFALALAREMRAAFRSPRVHIGCDETFELGLGVSREAVKAVGGSRVYLDHLKRILEPLQAEGAEVLFWGDILRSDPALVAELPHERVVALAWHYEAPLASGGLPAALRPVLARFGTTDETAQGFDAQVAGFEQAGVPFWVCPGTSSWNALIGRRHNARANLWDAATVGLARGATGFLITDWGDNGHLQPPSVSFEPVLYGGALAWGAAQNRDLDVAAWLDREVFQDEAGQLGAALAAMGDAYRHTGLETWNASALFEGLLPGRCLVAGELDVAATTALAERLGTWADDLRAARPTCSDGPLVVRELAQALRLAQQGAWRLLSRAGAPAPDEAMLQRGLAEAIEEQRACWLARSREGGLADSLARLEAEL